MSDLTGGASGYAAADKSRKAQQDAAGQAAMVQLLALKHQKEQDEKLRRDFEPYRQIGTTGAQRYSDFTAGRTNIEDTPGYRYAQGEIQKKLGRNLRSLGRENSTFGMNAYGDAYGRLAQSEYDRYDNQLLNQLKIGQGAAGSSNALGGAMIQAYGAAGNNLSDLALRNGALKTQYYQGMATGNERFNNKLIDTYSSLYSGMGGLGGMGGGERTSGNNKYIGEADFNNGWRAS